MLTVVGCDLCNESIRASVIIVKWLKKLSFVCVEGARGADSHCSRLSEHVRGCAVCDMDITVTKEGHKRAKQRWANLNLSSQ